MSDAQPAPSWRTLLAPRWIGWHLFAVAAVAGMMWLGDWQFRRAMAGNTLSWAYTFEWPIFAIFGVVFWIKTVRDEMHPAPAGSQARQVTLPPGTYQVQASESASGPQAAGESDAPADEADPELAEYNAYLAKLSNEVKGHGRWHGLR